MVTSEPEGKTFLQKIRENYRRLKGKIALGIAGTSLLATMACAKMDTSRLETEPVPRQDVPAQYVPADTTDYKKMYEELSEKYTIDKEADLEMDRAWREQEKEYQKSGKTLDEKIKKLEKENKDLKEKYTTDQEATLELIRAYEKKNSELSEQLEETQDSLAAQTDSTNFYKSNIQENGARTRKIQPSTIAYIVGGVSLIAIVCSLIRKKFFGPKGKGPEDEPSPDTSGPGTYEKGTHTDERDDSGRESESKKDGIPLEERAETTKAKPEDQTYTAPVIEPEEFEADKGVYEINDIKYKEITDIITTLNENRGSVKRAAAETGYSRDYIEKEVRNYVKNSGAVHNKIHKPIVHNRFNRKYLSDTMKKEIVIKYVKAEDSLDNLAHDIGQNHLMGISRTTLSKIAREELKTIYDGMEIRSRADAKSLDHLDDNLAKYKISPIGYAAEPTQAESSVPNNALSDAS